MSNKVVPREYQVDSIISILDSWSEGVQRPAVILPTGAGKTVVFSLLSAILVNRGHRPLILLARDELVTQTVAKLKAADPTMTVGVIQGERDEKTAQCTVGSVQTLSRQKRLDRLDRGRFDRIICDEAHWADSPSWRRVLTYFGAFEDRSGTCAVGFTATMTRSGNHKLGEIWTDICYQKDTKWAIEQGFLVRPLAQTVVLPDLDLSAVRTRNGDLLDGDLGKAMAQAKAGPLIAAAYNELARDRDGDLRRGILFAPTIETAEAFLLDFRAAGIPTEIVIGTTPRAERQRVYEMTRLGLNTVIASVGVLTTGFDLPAIEVAILARPTKSKGLYQQMAGRVLRPSPVTGKIDALLLDVVGVSRMGLASIVDLRISEEFEKNDADLDDLPAAGPRMPGLELEAPDQVGFRTVDALSGEMADVDEHALVRKRLLRKKALTQAWLLTKDGVPFLPATAGFDSTVFLHREDATCWTVGELPRQGKPIRHEECLPFPLAVEAAIARYPVTPRKLTGPASESQRSMLANFRVPTTDEMTKQEASELISVELVSRRLSGVS